VSEGGLDGEEEWEVSELTVLATLRLGGFEVIAGLEPVADLLDGDRLKTGREARGETGLDAGGPD
jgi:hypothetical protein